MRSSTLAPTDRPAHRSVRGAGESPTAFPVEAGRSVVHQPPPTLEQCRARMGGLDLVLDDVRQRRALLDHPVVVGSIHAGDWRIQEYLRRLSVLQ